MIKLLLVALILLESVVFACPGGQHDECVLPTPWGCKAWICVPDVHLDLPDIQVAINTKAFEISDQGKRDGTIKDQIDCRIIVVAALALWGGEVGGPVGAALGGGAGVAAADMACRRSFSDQIIYEVF